MSNWLWFINRDTSTQTCNIFIILRLYQRTEEIGAQNPTETIRGTKRVFVCLVLGQPCILTFSPQKAWQHENNFVKRKDLFYCEYIFFSLLFDFRSQIIKNSDRNGENKNVEHGTAAFCHEKQCEQTTRMNSGRGSLATITWKIHKRKSFVDILNWMFLRNNTIHNAGWSFFYQQSLSAFWMGLVRGSGELKGKILSFRKPEGSCLLELDGLDLIFNFAVVVVVFKWES